MSADCFHLQARPHPLGQAQLGGVQGCQLGRGAGRSIGGIGVDTARAFCGGGHGGGGGGILPTSISTDALWTVHLAGCESVTVAACLADNMAKGIHQLSWELRVS